MKVRILGCGTSSGVPRIGEMPGGDWGTCDPAEPRNRRSRASILIEQDGARILVDTGPDMRMQLIDAGIGTIDAVIWTHDHADHTHGIDDLRQVFHQRRTPVPGYARRPTISGLGERFDYVFRGNKGYPPTVIGHELPDRIDLCGVGIDVIDQPHGGITSAGLKFTVDGRSIVYSTDFHAMTDAMADLFAGTDLWIVDAFGHYRHPSHSHLEQTLTYIDRVKPGRALLTHMDNSMDYASLKADLPPHIEPAYDGLEVEL